MEDEIKNIVILNNMISMRDHALKNFKVCLRDLIRDKRLRKEYQLFLVDLVVILWIQFQLRGINVKMEIQKESQTDAYHYLPKSLKLIRELNYTKYDPNDNESLIELYQMTLKELGSQSLSKGLEYIQQTIQHNEKNK